MRPLQPCPIDDLFGRRRQDERALTVQAFSGRQSRLRPGRARAETADGRMPDDDSFAQGPSQVFNGKFEVQRAKWRRDRERTVAHGVDGVALRAMHAHEREPSLRGGRRLRGRRIDGTQRRRGNRHCRPARPRRCVRGQSVPPRVSGPSARAFQTLFAQGVERDHIGTVLAPDRVVDVARHVVLAFSLASAHRADALQIGEDLRLDALDRGGIERERGQPAVQQVGRIRPFSGQRPQFRHADADVVGHPLGLVGAATIQACHVGAGGRPFAPPLCDCVEGVCIVASIGICSTIQPAERGAIAQHDAPRARQLDRRGVLELVRVRDTVSIVSPR